MSGFVVEQFAAVSKNTLVGFATVRAPSGVVFHDCAVHRKADSWWVSPASKPILDRNGAQLCDPDGKKRFAPVVSFSNKEIRDRFSAAAIAALRVSHPRVFE